MIKLKCQKNKSFFIDNPGGLVEYIDGPISHSIFRLQIRFQRTSCIFLDYLNNIYNQLRLDYQ